MSSSRPRVKLLMRGFCKCHLFTLMDSRLVVLVNKNTMLSTLSTVTPLLSCRSALPQGLSACRWVCFLVLLPLAENMGRFSRTLISFPISAVFPLGRLPPLPLSCTHGHLATRPPSFLSNWELMSPSSFFYLCTYLSAVSFFGGSDGSLVQFTPSFSKSLSLLSTRPALTLRSILFYALVS